MGGTALRAAGLTRLQEVLDGHVAAGEVGSLAWVVARRGEVHAGTAGEAKRDTIFRIASMTKPITALAALVLVEECALRLDDPVDGLLPELADRQVLVRPDGPLDETVPAVRPITLRDLLTFRLGIGLDFTAWGSQTVMTAGADLGLGAGPPQPAGPPEPDEWMRRLGSLPLERQPGERWLYHVGSDVLGVLVARAAGRPLEDVLRERVFAPLGIRDTGFSVPAADLGRFGPCSWVVPGSDGPTLFDAADGQWSAPPAFPSGGGGLVSTVDDFLAFAELLLGRGTTPSGRRLVSRPTIEVMTTDHLTADQRAAHGPDPGGALGWGFGVGVQVRRTGPVQAVGSYGWNGGLGSSWANDPTEDLIGVLLTDRAFTSPSLPPVVQDFWTCTYAAIAD